MHPRALPPLDRVLIGWARYFNYGTCTSAYCAIDHHVATRVRRFLVERHRVSSHGIPWGVHWESMGSSRVRQGFRCRPTPSGALLSVRDIDGERIVPRVASAAAGLLSEGETGRDMLGASI
jgi:hypothetical protein